MNSASDSQTNKEKKNFQFNRTVINDFGYNLSSDQKLYEQLACPFEEDPLKAHPLCAKFPEGFLSADFNFDKVSDKLSDETLLYIFYNIMDQRLQISAADYLMNKCMKFHKSEKVWVRKKDNKFEYFDVASWQYKQFDGNTNQNFATRADFSEK